MTTPASYQCLYSASSLYGYNGVFVNDDGLIGLQQNDVPFDAGSCSHIMLSAADYNALTTAPITTDPVTTSPALFPALSAADGLLMSGAILGVWAIGYMFRMGIKALNSDDERN